MTRMITKKMRESFNVHHAKVGFPAWLCDKVELDRLLKPKKIKQRILILRRLV